MSTPALLMLALVGGFVWGGFLVLLIHALRREGSKASEERESRG